MRNGLKSVLLSSMLLAGTLSLKADSLSDFVNPANPVSPLSPANPANPASPLNPSHHQGNIQINLTDEQKLKMLDYSIYATYALITLAGLRLAYGLYSEFRR